MAPLSEVIKEAENIAGDLLQSLPDIGAIVKKIDPHAAAVDKIIELAPRLEAVVQELEQLAAIKLPEPPAPVTAAAAEEPQAEPEAESDQKVAIEVTPEQAAQLGKTPIQISLPPKA